MAQEFMDESLIYRDPATKEELFRDGDYVKITYTGEDEWFFDEIDGYVSFTGDGFLFTKVDNPPENYEMLSWYVHIVFEEIDEARRDGSLLIEKL